MNERVRRYQALRERGGRIENSAHVEVEGAVELRAHEQVDADCRQKVVDDAAECARARLQRELPD